MCRWFAYISDTESILLDDVLVKPDHAICKQVIKRYLPDYPPAPDPNGVDQNLQPKEWQTNYANADGMGIAYYAKLAYGKAPTIGGLGQGFSLEVDFPTVYKTLANPMNDPNFRSICKTTKTTAVFAHLRAASEGLPIHEYNCHPFQFGSSVLCLINFLFHQLIVSTDDQPYLYA